MKGKSRLMIRIGLGLFFLVFGLLKLTSANWFIEGPYKMFYTLAFPVALVYIVGIVQLAMAGSFFSDKYAKWSGYAASVMLGATILATLPKILTMFTLPPASPPPGFLFFSAVPLFFMALSEAVRKEK